MSRAAATANSSSPFPKGQREEEEEVLAGPQHELVSGDVCDAHDSKGQQD